MATTATTGPAGLERAQWRQLLWITVGAFAIYFALRLLPTGTNLSHMDFRVDAKGAAALEFCDPSNPQFIPVVAMRSPVVMTVQPESTPGTKPAAVVSGREVACVVTLRTASGKPIAPEDLLVTHTRHLHLLVVDATLTDYQHVHPQPGSKPGEWRFAFTPEKSGAYRVFADFTPAATGRGLYASADLDVTSASGAVPAPARSAQPAMVAEHGDFRFELTSAAQPIRAGQPTDLTFRVTNRNGGAVPLEPVMDAFAHLVAFDESRSGFAHLHPGEADVTKRPDSTRPQLTFKLTIPGAGRYVVWAQVNLGGEETFVPFWIDVV